MTQRLGSPSVNVDDEEQFMDENDVAEIIIDEGGDDTMDDDEEDGEQTDDGKGGMEEDEVVVEDTSILHFGAHSKSVFAIAGHPVHPLAASGGEDDMGYLWDLTTGEMIQALGGHSDSVNCVAFSSDGDFVATGGMDGKTRVWKRTGEGWKNWEFLTEVMGPDELVVCGVPPYESSTPRLYSRASTVAEVASKRKCDNCRCERLYHLDVAM